MELKLWAKKAVMAPPAACSGLHHWRWRPAPPAHPPVSDVQVIPESARDAAATRPRVGTCRPGRRALRALLLVFPGLGIFLTGGWRLSNSRYRKEAAKEASAGSDNGLDYPSASSQSSGTVHGRICIFQTGQQRGACARASWSSN
ncbi:hypothetical protein EJ06DRAFT_571685 [Trichodelitschia bisporula]|uniref:Uncharacterized protein n=1 Tax=Trichodelitschia bisporula TaxID=703511 RepID=A0A6G1I592_9PEZI|nr:hypothetical protein EJ06DRAFT_571685 [Trichodelitschia bisporula]